MLADLRRLAQLYAAGSLLFASGCSLSRLPDYPPAYREYAYVTNGKSGTVTVIDAGSYKRLKTIPVGAEPTGVAANPNKNEIYVVNAGSNNLTFIDAESNTVETTIGLEAKPYFIDVSQDGRRGYIANSGSNTVSVIDLEQRKMVRSIKVGDAPGIARVSADGKTVVVAERLGNAVSVIDATTMNVRSHVSVCAQPTDLVILPDSSKAYVACSGAAQVAVVGLNMSANAPPPGAESEKLAPKKAATAKRGEAQKKKATVHPVMAPSNSPDRLLALLDVGKTPVQLALKPDGGEVFSANFDGNTISEIYAGSAEVGSTTVIGEQPVRGLFSYDSSTLYVSNFGSDSVGVYSVDDGKLMNTVHVGSKPDAMALSANGNFLFVCDTAAGDVSVVRTAATQGAVLFTIVPVGEQPNAIAIKPFMLHKPPQSSSQ